jgi:hypothetical protein
VLITDCHAGGLESSSLTLSFRILAGALYVPEDAPGRVALIMRLPARYIEYRLMWIFEYSTASSLDGETPLRTCGYKENQTSSLGV